MWDFSVGHTDVEPPQSLTKAYRTAVLHAGRYAAYGEPIGELSLRKRLAERFAVPGIDLPESHVLVTPGAKVACALILMAVVRPGSEVLLVPRQYWPTHAAMVRRLGAEFVAADPEDVTVGFLEGMKDRLSAVLVCNPSNPTGRVLADPAVELLAGFCEARGIVLVEDAVYADQRWGPAAGRDFFSLCGTTRRVFSLGKSFSCPGWRLGGLISRSRPDGEAAVLDDVTSCANRPLQLAFDDFLRSGESGRFLTEYRAELAARSQAYEELLRAGGFSLIPPEAGMFIYAVSYHGRELSRQAVSGLANRLAAHGDMKVATMPYGGIRIALSRPAEVFAEALPTLCGALDEPA